MGPLKKEGGGLRSSLSFWTVVFLALAAALALTWRYLRPSPRPVPPASAAFQGDPTRATDNLLKALNARLESLDLLKLLEQEVETRPAMVGGLAVPTYSETFRLPLRYSAAQVAAALDEASEALGARRLYGPALKKDADGDLSYTYSFAYDPRWTPVQIRLVEIHAPKICLIIDDGGYQEGKALQALYGFKVPVTVSIIPDVEFSRRLAEEFPAHGVEVMCHLPMEGHEKGVVGNDYKELLKPGMDPARVEKEVEEGLDDLPNVRGLNNHMGSIATADPQLMAEVCRVLKARGLFAIDSRTTAQSKVESAARKEGVPVARRDVFLDNVETPAAILGQLDKTVAFARRHGLAVAIGHFKLTTLRTLEAAVGRLKDQGIQFVYASEVVQ